MEIVYDGDGLGSEFDGVQQVNAELDDDIQNEHNLSNNIDNREECDRLRKQIYDYKYNRDPEGTKWLTYYKQTFPILQNGTRLDDIYNPTIIS